MLLSVLQTNQINLIKKVISGIMARFRSDVCLLYVKISVIQTDLQRCCSARCFTWYSKDANQIIKGMKTLHGNRMIRISRKYCGRYQVETIDCLGGNNIFVYCKQKYYKY
jgi:hypothetical protein